MIDKVKLKNFKALRDIDIDVAPLNIYTGLNGMGKSTLMQALMLLRQSIMLGNNKLRLNYPNLLELGTYGDVFCESAVDATLSLGLEWNDSELPDEDRECLYLECSDVEPNETWIEATKVKGPFDASRGGLFGVDTFLYLSAERIGPRDAFPVDNSMLGMKQLGNHGEHAPYFYHIHKNDDITIKALAFDEEDTNHSIEYQLERWLQLVSPGVKVHTDVVDNLITLKYSYRTKDDDTTRFRARNAGFGLTYVFGVLVAILSAKKGDVLIIENPESHIHPKGQTELARLMALAATNGVQLFVETHSDHIIYGTRIAIKEQHIDKDQVRIFYFDRDQEEHFSKAHWIEIDEHGRMERKVSRYFREFEHHMNRLMS